MGFSELFQIAAKRSFKVFNHGSIGLKRVVLYYGIQDIFMLFKGKVDNVAGFKGISCKAKIPVSVHIKSGLKP